jgi:hypothetical protein
MTDPKPNPQWQYTPPATSKDGKTCRMDGMAWAAAMRHNEFYKIPPAEPRSRK